MVLVPASTHVGGSTPASLARIMLRELGRVLVNPVLWVRLSLCLLRTESDRIAARQRNDATGQQPTTGYRERRKATARREKRINGPPPSSNLPAVPRHYSNSSPDYRRGDARSAGHGSARNSGWI